MTETQTTTAIARFDVDPQALLMRAMEPGVDLEKLQGIVALVKEVRAEQARAGFYAALANFKAENVEIYKRRTADMGNFRYKFADLGDEDEAITPSLSKHGLSYRWETREAPDGKVAVECIVQHELGHKEYSGIVKMPVPKALANDRGANEMQREKIAYSYARRTSLEIALGLAPRREDDPDGNFGDTEDRHGDGGAGGEHPMLVISEKQAKLFYAVKRGQGWNDADVDALLKKHNVAKVEDIPRGKFDEILNAVKMEKKGQA
jgi:hypothetical protein